MGHLPGFAAGVPGPGLVIEMREQAERFGMKPACGSVDGLRREPPHSVLTIPGGHARA